MMTLGDLLFKRPKWTNFRETPKTQATSTKSSSVCNGDKPVTTPIAKCQKTSWLNTDTRACAMINLLLKTKEKN